MAQFVLIASGVSSVQFEKAIEIQIKATGKVSFVPQPTSNHSVNAPGMRSMKAGNGPAEALHLVRFEWTESGAEFGAAIVQALAPAAAHAMTAPAA